MDESLEKLMRLRIAKRVLQKTGEHGPINGPDLRQRVKHFLRPFDAMALTDELLGLGWIERSAAGLYSLTAEGALMLAGSSETVAHDATTFAPKA